MDDGVASTRPLGGGTPHGMDGGGGGAGSAAFTYGGAARVARADSQRSVAGGRGAGVSDDGSRDGGSGRRGGGGPSDTLRPHSGDANAKAWHRRQRRPDPAVDGGDRRRVAANAGGLGGVVAGAADGARFARSECGGRLGIPSGDRASGARAGDAFGDA